MSGSLDKITLDTPGITINGKDLKQILAEKEAKQREVDAENSRREEIGIKTKITKSIKPRDRFAEDPRRVHRRVRHLSEYEIRKEYGLINKPFPTLGQNVLYLLFHAGGKIGSQAIAKEINRPLPDVSSALSTIYGRLKPDNLIERERIGLSFQYNLTSDARSLGFQTVWEKYWPGSKPRKKREPAPVLQRKGPYAHAELPYELASHNIIHLVALTMGEKFGSREIAQGLGKPPANISSTLKMIVGRLERHGMIKLFGPKSHRRYSLHSDLANVKSDDLIEFITSKKKWWEQDKQTAWKFFFHRGSAAAVHLEESYEIETNFVDLARRMTSLEDAFRAMVREEVLNVPHNEEPVHTSNTGEFNINVNVRFLLGKSS